MKNFLLLVYCLILLCAAVYSLKKPAYNWDILPYMGVVLSYNSMEAENIHNKVYAVAREQIPTIFYNRLVDSSNLYRKKTFQSSEAFQSQMPFYVVKPLYTRFAWMFYQAGISLITSTVFPSVIAYFFMGLVLFFWLVKYWSPIFAFIGGILIMLSPPLLTVAGLSTPDALSGLLLFTAVYFLTEKKRINIVFILLVLSIFVRLDNIIPALCFLLVIFFRGKAPQKISFVKMVFFFSILVLAYLSVSKNATPFGWSIFFYPAFIKQLNISYSVSSVFSLQDYITLTKSQITTGIFFSFISLFLFFVVMLLRNPWPNGFNTLTIEETLAIFFVVIIVIRFLFQPLVADRLYVPYYLSVIAFLVKKNAIAMNGLAK